MVWILLGIYWGAMSIILIFSLIQFSLVKSYRKSKKLEEETLPPLNVHSDNVPFVTVQLPLYNEEYVVERLIDATSELKYPKDKLEIQILDDSTDDTTAIIKRKLASLGSKASIFKHIQRADRIGFKAGALNHGISLAKGELFAIFDADFIPGSDFLLETVPYFTDDKVGVVQTRWGHINRDYSFLTKIQAFALDAHFTIEQVGRNTKSCFINFNGTAGVWRGRCIEDAGGWQYDTITEDLDLSYRAQFRKWDFIYLENVVSPAELPVAMSAIKTQQFRWNKGAAQNFRKMKKRLSTEKMPFGKRIHAFAHLLNSSIFILIFVIGLITVPAVHCKANNLQLKIMFDLMGIFIISLIILMFFYWNSYATHKKGVFSKLGTFGVDFFSFLSTSMGLALHNTVAAVEGHVGLQSSFIRTPKFNVVAKTDSWKRNKYRVKKNRAHNHF